MQLQPQIGQNPSMNTFNWAFKCCASLVLSFWTNQNCSRRHIMWPQLMFSLLYVIRFNSFTKTGNSHFLKFDIQFFSIIRLMWSLMVWPKVITLKWLNGIYCKTIETYSGDCISSKCFQLFGVSFLHRWSSSVRWNDVCDSSWDVLDDVVTKENDVLDDVFTKLCH